MATAIAGNAQRLRELVGLVVNAGKMDRTVTVRVMDVKWNNRVNKYFKHPKQHLVHDPNNSTRLGDVLVIKPGFRASQHKRHVVHRIIAPATGVPLHERPPLPTEAERNAIAAERAAEKSARKAANRAARAAAAARPAARRADRDKAIKLRSFVMSGVATVLRENGQLIAEAKKRGFGEPPRELLLEKDLVVARQKASAMGRAGEWKELVRKIAVEGADGLEKLGVLEKGVNVEPIDLDTLSTQKISQAADDAEETGGSRADGSINKVWRSFVAKVLGLGKENKHGSAVEGDRTGQVVQSQS